MARLLECILDPLLRPNFTHSSALFFAYAQILKSTKIQFRTGLAEAHVTCTCPLDKNMTVDTTGGVWLNRVIRTVQ